MCMVNVEMEGPHSALVKETLAVFQLWGFDANAPPEKYLQSYRAGSKRGRICVAFFFFFFRSWRDLRVAFCSAAEQYSIWLPAWMNYCECSPDAELEKQFKCTVFTQ